MLFDKKTNRLVYCSEHIWKKIFLFKKNFVFKRSEKFIYERSSSIPKIFNGFNVFIYNGKTWSKKYITNWRVGYKFGEFTWNKKIAIYKAKQKKKKKKN